MGVLPMPKPVESWPPEVQEALFTLVAFACNEQADQMMFSLQGLTAGDTPLPEFEVTIRRL
jgi:hypothetical protein